MANFDLESYLDTVSADFLKEDALRRFEQKETISKAIELKELKEALKVVVPEPGDRPGPNLDKVYSMDFQSLDWDNELLAPFRDIFSNMDDMYEFFNVEVDFSNTNSNPFKEHGHKIGWKRLAGGSGSSSTNFSVTGDSWDNWENNPQSNPYYFFSPQYSSAYQSKSQWNAGNFWVDYSGIAARNMYRYDAETLKQDIFPSSSELFPDIFSPFALEGDHGYGDWETVVHNNSNGPSYQAKIPSIWNQGYTHSKYAELDSLVRTHGGHYSRKENGDLVFIKQPDNYKSIDSYSKFSEQNLYNIGKSQDRFMGAWSFLDEGEMEEQFNLKTNVDSLYNQIEKNNWMLQSDFMGKFGKDHSYLAIWQADRQNLFSTTVWGNDISDRTFYSEESSDIPGLHLTYTAGNSLFALGMNYDPSSKQIRDVRFGQGYPFPQKLSPLSEAPLRNHQTMAKGLFSSHVDPMGYREVVVNPSVSVSAKDLWNGSLPVLGFDSNHQYADLLASVNPEAASKYEYSDFSRYYEDRGNKLHSGQNFFINDFSKVLENYGYSDEDITLSNSAADGYAEETWKAHTFHILSNVDKVDIDPNSYITQGYNQFTEMYQLILNTYSNINENENDLNNLNDIFKTSDGQAVLDSTK